MTPAIETPMKAEHLSKRYEMIQTSDLIGLLQAEGFELAASKQKQSRSADPRTVFHYARMRHVDYKAKNGSLPEIVITNANDGTAAAKIHVGLFRLVCENGLVVGSQLAPVTSIRHNVNSQKLIIEAAQLAIKTASETARRIEVFRSKVLSNVEQEVMAERVAKKLYDTTNALNILSPRRPEDDRPDLWSTFNRIQENVVKGGIQYIRPDGKATVSRRIRGSNAEVKINQYLWEVAEAFL